MSQSMYEQAILDAQNLRRMAEESAKNELIRSLEPQIKEMIENEIFSNEDFVTESRHKDVGEEIVEEEDGDEPLLLDEEEINESDLKALAALIKASTPHTKSELNESLKVIRKKLARMVVLSESVDPGKLTQEHKHIFLRKINDIIRETLKLRREAILIRESGDSRIYNNVEKTLQEIKIMARKLDRGVFSKLFEVESLDELDATLTLAPANEEEADEVEELLGDLDIELELETPLDDEDEEDEEDDADLDDDDEDDEEVELDLGEGEHVVTGEGYREGDMDETYEIDEAALRRALRTLTEEATDSDPHLTHGGETDGDVLIDIDEDDLLHALNDELGDAPMPTVESSRRARRSTRSSKVNESRRARRSRQALQEARKSRVLKGQLRRATGAVNQLKGQLNEMNLFNAKLLYANKLMQNRNLNARQQRTIVEALDSAKTLREAKLLYKSLSTGISKAPWQAKRTSY